jgi:signal transduction histidine kinase
MHGDADDIDTIVLTKKDYQKVIHSSPVYQASMAHIFAARTALFIGYGLKDLDLDLILGAHASLYKDYGRRHYAFFPDAGKVLTKSFSEHYNITIIPYSSKNNHKELQLMMEELSKQVRALPPSTGDEELQRLKQLIDIERLYCEKLGTYTELERAKFLRSRMHEASFTQEEREFIRASIQHWETLADEKEKLVLGVIGTGVSHEFGRVLSAIQKQSSILASQAPDGPLRQSANEIVWAVKQGGRLVSFLQSFGKTPPIDLFNINDLLHKMKGRLSSVIEENEKLVFELFGHSLWVTCAPSMLEQALFNLVVNARDAIPHKGLITVATTAVSITNEYLADHPDARVGSFVCISVSDKGCGISAKHLPHIFEPFFSSKKKNGTGLGLYISREIVRKNGGWIEVETLPRRGSTFSVFLPEVDQPK